MNDPTPATPKPGPDAARLQFLDHLAGDRPTPPSDAHFLAAGLDPALRAHLLPTPATTTAREQAVGDATDPANARDEESEGCSPWSCHAGHHVPSDYEQAA